MSPDELRYKALVVMAANLERLAVFESSLARIDGRDPDRVTVAELADRVAHVDEVIHRAAGSGAVGSDDVEAVRPVADELATWIREYYEADRNGPARTVAAFGAADAHAADRQLHGMIGLAGVFGHVRWADSMRQEVPASAALRQRAIDVVDECSRGEPDDVTADWIRRLVENGGGERSLVVAEVDQLPALLDGREPDADQLAQHRPEAILSTIIHNLLELPDLVDDPRWDTFSTVVEVTDDSVAASAFRYEAGRPPIPTSAPRDLAAFTRLRDSMRSDGPEPWAVCIVRIHRDTARSTVNFVYPEEAPLWRITPAAYGRIAEALRPVDADFASAGPSA